ncbi:MAG: hypothetical protein HRT74_07445 [Flavobacteriales bacterium]|nr:hypothetical protein [Flavobacteriales bacterium]
MKQLFRVFDFAASLLVLYAHASIVFWQENPILKWYIKDFEPSETIRLITDILILAIVVYHLLDLALGQKLWPKLRSNKKLQITLIICFLALTFPYLRLWFLLYFLADIWTDMLVGSIYLIMLLFWGLNTSKLSKAN